MTREEAINIVRNIYQTDKEKEALSVLVPELRESEDEKIRNEIIDYLHLVGKGDGDYAQPMIDRWITWLEQQECGEKGLNGPQEIGDWRGDEGVCKKQKEQKLKEPDWCHHKVDLSGCSEEYMKAYYDGWNNCNQQYSQCKAEQKPAEKQDYSGLNDLERVIHRGFLSAGVENVPVTIIKETANECKRIANENANAEWSEDDKSFYDSIMCEVVKEGMHPTPEQANWLKSLPKRFNLQSKQDWSEEDECYINGLIGLIEDMEVGISPKLRGVAADRCVAFLKSLRPRPHWKPSKEQMNCLCAAVDAAIRKHNESVSEYKPARVLKSLYEQLQRLGVKEEPEYYQHFDPDC